MIRLQNAVNNYITNKGGGKDYQPIDYIVNTEDVIALARYIDENGQVDDDNDRYITDIDKAQEILKVNLNDAVKAMLSYGHLIQKGKNEDGFNGLDYSSADIFTEDNNTFIKTYGYGSGGIYVTKTIDKIYFLAYN